MNQNLYPHGILIGPLHIQRKIVLGVRTGIRHKVVTKVITSSSLVSKCNGGGAIIQRQDKGNSVFVP